jgi:predicted dienelactone hydrolase
MSGICKQTHPSVHTKALPNWVGAFFVVEGQMMMKQRLVLFVVIGLFLLLFFPFSLAAQDEPLVPEPVGLRPDAPTYALHGPYWVGTQEFVLEGETNPHDIRVWYPALNPTEEVASITYTISWIKYGFDVTSDIAGNALADGAPDTNAAPYPLIVFSHGYGSESILYAWLVEHLASYGFVVIAPDHQESTDEASGLVRTTIVRPQAITNTLDYAEALNAPDGVLAGLIDMDRVAVAGHSYGGYTALAAGGARYDMDAYKARCAVLPPDHPDQPMCFLADSQVEMAQFAELASPPQGLWPSVADPRIDAVVSLAGDSYMFGEQGQSEITVPVLAMGGTLDTSTFYEWGIHPTYDQVSSAEKILVTLENADHFLTGPICADAPSLLELDAFYLCSDPVWDISRAHDLMGHFTTAFLLDELKGDAAAAAALAPDAVSFPGIRYEAQGF